MKILHLGFEDHRRPNSGGGSLRNREINSRLSSRHQITVLTANYRGAKSRVEDGVRYQPVGLPFGYFISILSYFAVLPFKIRRFPSDLVVEEFGAPLSSVSAPLFTCRPTLAVVQWMNARGKSRQYRLPFLIFEWLGLKVHRDFITVSEDMRSEIVRRQPGARVHVIGNGVDKTAFDFERRPGQAIVYIGRLELVQKGLDFLMAAFDVVARVSHAPLVIVGDGPDRDRLESLVKDMGLGERVKFCGWLSGADKFRVISQAKVVAIPSRYETFGIVAVEALAVGAPVVAFNIPCLRDVVPVGGGEMVPAFDVPAYASALLRAVERAEVRDEAVLRREYARRFDWDQLALDQEAVYEQIFAARTRQV